MNTLYLYGSPTCPPCQVLKPVFEAVALDYPNIEFTYVDTSLYENPETDLPGIVFLPTLQFVANNVEVYRLETSTSEQDLRGLIEQHLVNPVINPDIPPIPEPDPDIPLEDPWPVDNWIALGLAGLAFYGLSKISKRGR